MKTRTDTTVILHVKEDTTEHENITNLQRNADSNHKMKVTPKRKGDVDVNGKQSFFSKL